MGYLDMLYGWLVVNGFFISDKFEDIYERLFKAASKYRVRLKRIANNDITVCLQDDPFAEDCPDFVLFWDKDIRLARYLENKGVRLFNSAEAIELCDDKSMTCLRLQQAGLDMPKTIIGPMTFDNVGYLNWSFLDSIENSLGYPMIIKCAYGSFGQQVYLAKNRKESKAAIDCISPKPIVFQEYIEESAGKDLRLQVVGNEVIGSMIRQSAKDEFRANLSLGGQMRKWQPSIEESDLAIKACKALNLDFAGVDILLGENDRPLICEVNSNAHFKTLYQCTGINTAEEIMKYIRTIYSK